MKLQKNANSIRKRMPIQQGLLRPETLDHDVVALFGLGAGIMRGSDMPTPKQTTA